MLNFYRLDYIPEEPNQITYYDKCKYCIKVTCPWATVFLNILLLMLNIYFIMPYLSNYYNSDIIGYIIVIAINSVFIITSIVTCMCII